MYYVCKPKKVSIYINIGRKTASQIQRELGCDVLINGGLYDMQRFYPDCWLKADGKLLNTWRWSAYGYGWDTDKLVMDTSVNIGKHRNFINMAALIRNGEFESLDTLDKALRGIRGRTAIGTRPNGEVVVWCTADGAYALTPEQLQMEMRNLGCKDALMLDGGASSHCITPIGTIPPSKSRPYVYDYIAIWTGEVEEKPKPVCPYAEPTYNVRWGSIGSGAKWVQWQLNRNGAALDVDGLFFGKSVEALKKFQHDHGLAWDGVCGPLTREELAK